MKFGVKIGVVTDKCSDKVNAHSIQILLKIISKGITSIQYYSVLVFCFVLFLWSRIISHFQCPEAFRIQLLDIIIGKLLPWSSYFCKPSCL